MASTRFVPAPARALVLTIIALLTAGCERALFGVINRGVDPPSASVVFDRQLDLALDVYRPAGTMQAPVVVFFYGGSWQRGEREQYAFVGQRLADNGALVIVADYRTWPRAGFPEFMEDGANAVAWARSNAVEYGGDPQRLFISGHSAGAQIAALLGTDARYLARAGVSIDDIAGVIGLSGPYNFEITGEYREIFAPPSQYPAAQALNFVDGDEPPFLLIHGGDDRVVETRDSVQLAARLETSGGSATLLLLPDAGHFATAAGLYRSKYAPQVLPAILDFIGAQRADRSAARDPGA